MFGALAYDPMTGLPIGVTATAPPPPVTYPMGTDPALASGELSWQEREAREGLALQQVEAEKARRAQQSWWGLAQEVPGNLAEMAKGLVAAPARIDTRTPVMGPAAFGTLSPGEEAMQQEGPVGRLGRGLGHVAAEAVVSGVTAPHDAMTGEIPQWGDDGRTSPTMVQRAFDTAGLAGGASVAGTAERGALRAAPMVAMEDTATTGAPIAALGGANKPKITERPNFAVREADGGFEAYVGKRRVGRMILENHPENGQQAFGVLVQPQYRRQGVATALYDAAEQAKGKINPSVAQTEEAFQFWKARNPEALGDDLRLQRDKVLGQPVETEHGPGRVKSVGTKGAIVELDGRGGATSWVPKAKLAQYLAADSGKAAAPIAALEHAKPFFTSLEPALEATGRAQATGAQWANELKRYGAKPEELDWRGVTELLTQKANQPISRNELAAHIESRPVELKPVDRMQPPEWERLSPEQKDMVASRYIDRYGEEAHSSRNPDWDSVEEFYRNQKEHGAEINGLPITKWDEYQLPGGENYRERVMTLPNRQVAANWQVVDHPDMKGRYAIQNEVGEHGRTANGTGVETFRSPEEARAAIREYATEAEAGPTYKSSHWDEPNPLYHRRSTDRTMQAPLTAEQAAAVEARKAAEGTIDTVRQKQGELARQIRETVRPLEFERNGEIMAAARRGEISMPEAQRLMEQPIEHPRLAVLQEKLQALRAQEDGITKGLPPEPKPQSFKTLHAEEIQSDWHQTGRTKGYGTGLKDGWRTVQLENGEFSLYGPQDKVYPIATGDKDAVMGAAKRFGGLSEGVPDAPLKDSWHRSAAQDMLREAAEGGYDRVSWTAGRSQPTNPKNLGSGGDAERLAKADKGMAEFYDTKMVNTFNKLGKAHGVSVQKGSIADNGPMSGERAMQILGVPAEEQAAVWQRAVETPGGREKLFEEARAKGHDIFHMDVPQSLKEQALQKGFSMFEDTASTGAPLAAAEHATTPASAYHGLMDQPKAAPALDPHGFGPLGANPIEQALTVNDILSPETPKMKPRSRDVETIAKELMDRGSSALEKLGVEGGRIEKSAPRTDEILSRAIASEIKSALERGGSAADWYTQKIAEAMDIASEMHPELKNNPHQKMGFTAALAITSQGEAVTSNVRLANQVYEHFKKTGRFPETVEAKNGGPMGQNFMKMNDLLDKMGPEGTREFLHREFTVKELEQAGYDVGGENKQAKVYGSSILGPKIGQGFYQNLNGNYKPVTMDLWFMRAWGRMTGTLVGKTDLSKPTARLQAALKADGRNHIPDDPAELAQIAREAVLKHERDFRANRAEYNSGKRSKSELTYAAERYEKNASGINEQPTSGSQRQWMRDVVNRSRELLEAEGHKVTNADLQAIWWYPEKELYGKLGGRDSDKINIDYATAFRDLKNNKGAAANAEGTVRTVVGRPGPASKADDAAAVKSSRGGNKKADGPKVKTFGSLAMGEP